MKNLIISGIFLLLLLSCCQNNKESSVILSNSSEINNVAVDRLHESLSTDTVIENADSIKSIAYKGSKKRINHSLNSDFLEDFLQNPLDFQKFKEKKGSSNSRIYSKSGMFYRPTYVGFYIHYFIFEGIGENGARIIAFRDKEKSKGSFLDNVDSLIQVFSNLPDPDLNRLDLVHEKIKTIKEKLGTNFLEEDGYIYYANNFGTLLTIYHGNSDFVIWFKWTRMKKTIHSIDQIPNEIKNENDS